MDRQIRRKLAMAASVRTFSRAHPSADTSYVLVLDRLDGTIVRIEELAKQQEGGYVSKHASSVRRSDLRRRLQFGLLRHLVTVAEDAGSEEPAVAGRFRLPNGNATHTAFRTSAAKLLEEARANQDILVKHGLSATLLEDLDAGVKEFDASTQESDDGKQSHVAARAEMKALTDEIMRLVGILDGFNRYRFHHDPELIAAWESARHVVSGPQPKEADLPGTPPATGLETAA
jgi:hypothetical protein